MKEAALHRVDFSLKSPYFLLILDAEFFHHPTPPKMNGGMSLPLFGIKFR